MSEPPGKRQKVSLEEGLTEQPKEKKITIPKIIHFVWAGGEKQMSEERIGRIADWSKKNPDFKIWIWVDYISAAGDTIDLKKKGVIDHFSKNIDFSEVPIEIKDVNENLYCDLEHDRAYAYFNYEIDRLRPNYGASSDILRYKILYKYGGVYFDSDVLVGDSALKYSVDFERELSGHIMQLLYVDPKSQNQTLFIGNDAFIVTRSNPAMLAILENALERYSSFSFCDPKYRHISYEGYDSPKQIEEDTPCRTGPRAVDKIVLIDPNKIGPPGKTQFDMGNVRQEYEGSHILPIPEECRKVVRNDKAWLGIPIPKWLPQEVFLEKIINSSVFEWRELNILRLNDHFYNFYEIYGPEVVFPLERFLNELASRLAVEKLDISNKYVQEIKCLNDYIERGKKQEDGSYTVQIGNPGRCPMSIVSIVEEYSKHDRSLFEKELDDNKKVVTEAMNTFRKYQSEKIEPSISRKFEKK